jgi:serine/threonine protein kinase/tetratricopeptide (TPR) repeat protein
MPEHRSTPVLVNRTLAHYRVLAQLGKGGMGEVYLAEDLRLRRRVALKVLPPDLAEEPRHLERFRREARSVAALNHPNIVTLYSVEEAEGLHFLVLEVVEGETLADLLAHGPLPLDRLLPIAHSLAEALEAAHACGVIHRDLKPRNVMVSREGRVKILDFGIARWVHAPEEEREDDGTPETDLTKTGRLIGTAAYMSPEQIQGEPVDPRSDLFSLGVLLYEMATGQQPFQGKSRLSTMAAVLHDTPPPPSTLVKGLPDRFNGIVSRCLAKEPSQRYQDAAELRRDLDAFSEQREAPLSSEAETETSLLKPSSDTGGRSLTSPRVPALPRCFGREKEVQALAAALCSDPPPPVPVLGPAGAGKSTITLATLHDQEVIERFGRRRFFIRCDAATSRDSLIGAIARSVCPEAVPPLDLKIFLELEEAPAVLVLDNFETPWELDTAAVEELLTELAAVPGLALVVALRGEQRPFGPSWREAIHAGPLDPLSARSAFLAISGERYQNDPDLDPLLLDLDGLALAVILLASQAEGEPDLSMLRQRWQEQRTAVLQRAGAQERLQSLEVSLRLSIDSPRMAEESRRLLAILGLLPEGVAREDLMELLPHHGRDAASVLRKVGLAFDQGSRLRLLAPIREYVRQHHPPLPEDLDRTIDHYLALARLGEKIGAEGGAEVTKRLRREAGNLEAMILKGLERLEAMSAIVSALAYGEVICFTGQGSTAIIVNAQRAAATRGDARLEASCVFRLGEIEFSRSRAENSQAAYEQALIRYREAEDRKGEASCLLRMGEVDLLLRSDSRAASRLFNQALLIFRNLGDLSREGQCLAGLGGAAINNSDFATARVLLQEARSLLQLTGDKRNEANCLQRMGHGSLAIGDLKAAQSEYEEALALFRQVGSLLGEANCIRSLGHIALDRDDPVTAQTRFEKALILSRRVGSKLGEANCLYLLGEAARELEQLDRADALLQQGRRLYQRIGQLVGEANCTEGLGANAAARSDLLQARYWFDQALTLFEEVPQPASIGRIFLQFAKLSLPGSPERLTYIESARQTWEKAGLLNEFQNELEAIAQASHSLP